MQMKIFPIPYIINAILTTEAIQIFNTLIHTNHRYSYAEDDMVQDPKLAQHLQHFGINRMAMSKARVKMRDRCVLPLQSYSCVLKQWPLSLHFMNAACLIWTHRFFFFFLSVFDSSIPDTFAASQKNRRQLPWPRWRRRR